MDRDRYEILDVIGSGGMATVWRARDRRLGRLVAVKRPHPAPDGSDVHTRFAREARAAATVSHPNLVPVYDSGEDDAGPFLVMAFVDGPSLATADLPRERAAAVGAEVASGLAALHAAGVVHGDVKPGNILLADGRAQLTDFGIARSLDDTAITRAGVGFGTPAYAAPETRREGTRTRESDVYSLAAVVYELATGARWSGDPSATAPMPAGHLATALAPALSDDPSARPTAGALATALASGGHANLAPQPAAIEQTVPLAHPPAAPTPTHRSRAPFAGLAVVGLAAVIGAGVLLARDGDSDTVASSPLTTQPDEATATPSTAPATPPSVAATTAATTVVTTTPTTATTTPATTSPTTVPMGESALTTLVALVEASAPGDLKPKDARDIVDRLERAERAAADRDADGDGEDHGDDEVVKQMREAAERMVRDVDDDRTLARMHELLVEISDDLDVDPEDVIEPFEERDDDRDEDDDD